MQPENKMLEIIRKKCKDEKVGDFYSDLINEIFTYVSKYRGGPLEIRKNNIKKIIDKKSEECL